MACSLIKFNSIRLSISRLSPQINSSAFTVCQNGSRQSYSSHWTEQEDRVVVADNGSTIVCWHPEPKFPYECSLPLPQPAGTHSVLKTQEEDIDAIFNIHKPQFQREYLMKVTHTTKHRWFPKPSKKYSRKTQPDREFL